VGDAAWHCAGNGEHAMAELLLRHGADPNGRVYASGSRMFQAFSRRDWTMAKLLERFGGAADATTAPEPGYALRRAFCRRPPIAAMTSRASSTASGAWNR
jgi:hypothetical protein